MISHPLCHSLKKAFLPFSIGTALLLFTSQPALAVNVTPAEMAAAGQWVAAEFGAATPGVAPAEPPFSFNYGGKASADLLKSWEVKRSERQLDPNRTEITLAGTDPATGLSIRCVAVEYRDFPVIEWTLYFKNTGSNPTPILSDIRALDTRFTRKADAQKFVLHYNKGSRNSADDYAPREQVIGKGSGIRLAVTDGRPSDDFLPYMNLAGDDGGTIIAVGWPGQWAASFEPTSATEVRVQTGQELTHFKLEPGEEVRGPLVAALFWEGKDWIRAQNLWRSWMIRHNLPRPGGQLPPTQFVASGAGQFNEMLEANEENQIMMIRRYLAEGLRIDSWWMDAGWYVNDGTWENTGTWEVDRKRFPNGLRAITDFAHGKGIKNIVWFEPERVTPKSWLYETHPEWCLTTNPPYKHDWRLLDLGNPEAWQWLIGHVDKVIQDEGIDLYRQDFNIRPLKFWRDHDAPDRQGITEIRYITGYLAYWDELRRRHPTMLIDSCASGGRRNDLETLRRAVPLWRSDYAYEPVSQQNHTYGLAMWIPYFGTGTNSADPYSFRSDLGASLVAVWDLRRPDLDYAELRRLVGQFRKISDCFLGDYYPLTSYGLKDDCWTAWQFDRPDLGVGVIQVFRRGASPYESARFQLLGLDPAASYAVTNLDVAGEVHLTGRELMENGLAVTMNTKPAALVFSYRRMK